MAKFERGFKAWCERTASLVRGELGLSLHDPLDLGQLADYLGVILWTPADVPGITNDDLRELLGNSSGDWYAVGLQDALQSIIIYNPKQSSRRQASDIAHEIAHFLLEHEPARIILSESEALEDVWLRTYDQKQEDEANCLGWTLLAPRDGLATLVRKRYTLSQMVEQFGVSDQLIKFRLNSTGVRKQYYRWK